MNLQENLKTIKKLWSAFAAYYQVSLTDQQVQMYADDCEGYSAEAIGSAMKAWRANPKHMRLPLPGQILETLSGGSAKSNANLLIVKLIAAVKKYDYTWPIYANKNYYRTGSFERDFQSELGDEAWQVVEAHGGWANFCESYWSSCSNETAFKAQLRDLAEIVIDRGRSGELVQFQRKPEIAQQKTKGPNPQLIALLRDEAKEKGLTEIVNQIDRLARRDGA